MAAHQETTRVSDLAGVLSIVPTLVGYQPTDSLVGLFLSDKRLALTMRCDLGEGLAADGRASPVGLAVDDAVLHRGHRRSDATRSLDRHRPVLLVHEAVGPVSGHVCQLRLILFV